MKKYIIILITITIIAASSSSSTAFALPEFTQQDLQYADEVSRASVGLLLFIGEDNATVHEPSRKVTFGKNIYMYNDIEKSVTLEESPIVADSTVLVPLRFITDNISATVIWNMPTQQLRIINRGHVISLTVNSRIAVADNKSVELAAAPVMINGCTMIPLDLIYKHLGIHVNWYKKSGSIVIGYDYLQLRKRCFNEDIDTTAIKIKRDLRDLKVSNLIGDLVYIKSLVNSKDGQDIFKKDGTVNWESVEKDRKKVYFGWNMYTKRSNQDIAYDTKGPGMIDSCGITYHTLKDCNVFVLKQAIMALKYWEDRVNSNGDTWFNKDGSINMNRVITDFSVDYSKYIDISKFSKNPDGEIIYDKGGKGISDSKGNFYHSLNDFKYVI